MSLHDRKIRSILPVSIARTINAGVAKGCPAVTVTLMAAVDSDPESRSGRPSGCAGGRA
jgi:hypothetical protein